MSLDHLGVHFLGSFDSAGIFFGFSSNIIWLGSAEMFCGSAFAAPAPRYTHATLELNFGYNHAPSTLHDNNGYGTLFHQGLVESIILRKGAAFTTRKSCTRR